MVIARKPLREEVYSALVERILSRDLPPGSRINDQTLCADLGVSRTPLREALIRLEQDGFLRADVARGFTVQPLSIREVAEVYPIMWTLESLAIRLVGNDIRKSVDELQSIVDEMCSLPPKDFTKVEELDLAFHAKLRQGCGNDRLTDLLINLRRVLLRYEMDYWSDKALRERSIADHQCIVDLLRDGDIEGAIEMFVTHYQRGMESTLARLSERDAVDE